MGHVYGEEFMGYAAVSSRYAAETVVGVLGPTLGPASVLDVGCAGGAWLQAWMTSGVRDVRGVDGDYVNRSQLLIPEELFQAADLAQPLDLTRRFDLVQSLEVAEHIVPAASATFIESLTRHAERFVLFSAAPPGQGGEYHINERPYEYWRGLFATHGFVPFDCVRPLIAHDGRVSFWYRYNTLLYARAENVASLPEAIRRTAVGEGNRIPDIAPLPFRLRKAAVRLLPLGVQHELARLKSHFFPTGRM
jgi:SAM-dependent methyltransferase